MDYSSTRPIASQKHPGVVFTILKITAYRRAELAELQAEATARLNAAQEKIAPVAKRYREAVDASKAAVEPKRAELVAGGMSREGAEKEVPLAVLDFPDPDFRDLVMGSDLVRKIDRDELTPIAVEYVLAGIEGLSIDGEPATLALLRQKGPDSVYQEIADAVEHEIGLTQEERENLSSPSTSAGAVDGGRTVGSATSAGRPATIINGGALSSTAPANASAPAIG